MAGILGKESSENQKYQEGKCVTWTGRISCRERVKARTGWKRKPEPEWSERRNGDWIPDGGYCRPGWKGKSEINIFLFPPFNQRKRHNEV